jgi:hypothetical protein
MILEGEMAAKKKKAAVKTYVQKCEGDKTVQQEKLACSSAFNLEIVNINEYRELKLLEKHTCSSAFNFELQLGESPPCISHLFLSVIEGVETGLGLLDEELKSGGVL